MFVILVYDVKSERVSKVMRVVKKHLVPVQESVFEGFITEKDLRLLKNALYNIIDVEYDYIKIYCFESVMYSRQEQIGKLRNNYSTIL